MAQSPVPVLIIIGLYVAIYSVIIGGTAQTYGLDTAPDIEEPSSGFFDILASIINSVFTVVGLILGALIFNVPDAPTYIQIPIAIAIIGSLSWSIATLIRGD